MDFQRGSLSWDWFTGVIPRNTEIDKDAYVETTYSFTLYTSDLPDGLRMAKGSSVYKSSMFDVGNSGRVSIGEYSLIHGARILCDHQITIGSYVFISWNVVLMDGYRVPIGPEDRRRVLQGLCTNSLGRKSLQRQSAEPIVIGSNVWIGFDSCILPGVHIGDGSIVGARSVVTADVEPYSVVAGNPARVIRHLDA